MLGETPVAEMTRSAGSDCPSVRLTARCPPDSRISATRAPVITRTPWRSHQAWMSSLARGGIMRGTMRSPISTTTSSTPRAASASMMMQPMKPAPICSTRLPFFARAAIARASASVQHGCTPGRSIPGIGGRLGCEPVATRSRSQASVSPDSRRTARFPGSTAAARPALSSMPRRSKCPGSLRSHVPGSSMFPINRYGIAMRE